MDHRKIALVTELFYPSFGGQEIRFKELGSEFSNLGHGVDLYTIDYLGDLEENETINGINVFRIIKDSNYYKGGVFGRKISSIIKFSFAVQKYLNNGKYDIIIFNQWPIFPQIIYSIFGRRSAKTAVDFVEFRTSMFWKIFNILILNSSKQIVFISDEVKNKSTSLIFRKSKASIIPSSVYLNNFTPTSGSDYLFLGRLEPHKNPEEAIKAILGYNEESKKSLLLTIIGGGTLYDFLKNKYKDFKNIRFLGSVSDEEKYHKLSQSKVLILPSEREGLPKSIIECLVCGIPTITTIYPNNASHKFVTDKKIGISCLPGTKNIIAAIHEMERYHEDYKRNCLDQINDYDVKQNTIKYLEIFKN